MKWLKHMTATWDDERVARLVDKGGMEGLAMYGLYWRVQEIIAAQMEGKNPPCSIRYTVTRWSLLLSLRGSLVFSTLLRLGATGLVTVERDGDDILVTNRNLLKYRDEYSRKSGESTDNVPTRTDKDGEEERKEEVEQKKTIAQDDEKHRPAPLDISGVFDLPLPNKSSYAVPEILYREYINSYPGVSVMGEFGKMRTWLLSNPKKMKTRTGMPRFMNQWLDRAQNDASKNNGGFHAPILAGKTDSNMVLSQELIAEDQYRSRTRKNGVVQAGEAEQDGRATLFLDSGAVGHEGVSGGNGYSF